MPKVTLPSQLPDDDIAPEVQASVVPTAEAPWYSNDYEGQLSVDVYQTASALVVVSTMAGVKAQDLEITLNNDVITIRGKRYQEQAVPPEDYFYQECYWGGFSRSIVLPVEVKPEGVKASLKNGVLTVVLPKAARSKKVEVKVEADGEDGV